MGLLMVILFGVGILFGNLGALAMQPLGKMAGLGAAVVGFLSSLLSVLISIVISAGMESSYQPVAIGFCVCALLGVLAIRWAIGSTRAYKMSVQAPLV